MPQLDSTTFVIQYLSIFFVLVIVYFLLSYLVLPSVLRVLLIRIFFVEKLKTINFLSSSSNKKTTFSLLFFKNPLNSLFNSVSSLSNIFMLQAAHRLENNLSTQIFLTQKYLEYLTVFLLLENNK